MSSGVGPISLVASGTIRPMRAVKVSGNKTAAECDANERSIGIALDSSREWNSADHAQSGENVSIVGVGQKALLEAGGDITAGDFLKSDADGKGVVILTNGTAIQNVIAQALEAGASGQFIEVIVRHDSIRPALS